MLLYQTVLFDLDGTLIESAPGIFACARIVMQEMGMPLLSDEEMRPLVGPPLAVGFAEVLHMPEESIPAATARYRLLAKTEGLDVIHPYAGVIEMLKQLKERGATVCVVTSKITPTAKEHIAYYGIAPYVDHVWGGVPGGTADKTELLQGAVDALAEKRGSIVMIGDRKFDIEAANNVGIPSVGVLYGYGSEEEIALSRPTHTAKTVEDLASLLMPSR